MSGKLAIFDLDGTLFDTAGVNYASYRAALAEEGYALERGRYESQCNGKYYKDYLPLVAPGITPEAMERVHARKMESYGSFLKEARENGPLFSLLETLRPAYATALVTTASRENCMEILRYFGRETLFDLILTHAEVQRKKPNPEGFLRAMAHFDAAPCSTVIFEDSPDGLEAARAAGACVLKVESF